MGAEFQFGKMNSPGDGCTTMGTNFTLLNFTHNDGYSGKCHVM